MIQIARKIPMCLTALILSMIVPLSVIAEETNPQFENLVRVEGSEASIAYIDPEADFSVFDKVMVLDTHVAFRSGWERDQRRGSRSNRVSARDMDRIKSRVSELFNSVLIDELEADDGFSIVSEPDYNVLLVRAAIINLNVTAPQNTSASRVNTFTANSGSATLYIELFDSVSGQIIGRAIDSQAARRAGSTLQWTSRASNTQDARRVFRGWAGNLRGFLDAQYSGK